MSDHHDMDILLKFLDADNQLSPPGWLVLQVRQLVDYVQVLEQEACHQEDEIRRLNGQPDLKSVVEGFVPNSEDIPF